MLTMSKAEIVIKAQLQLVMMTGRMLPDIR